LLFLFINSCGLLPFGQDDKLADFVLNNELLFPAKTNSFVTTTVLPNGNFKEDLRNQPEIKYNTQGEMLLQPGDYIIPVMTFCLKHNADSPSGYIYTLNKLQGSSNHIIKQLSLKALVKYSTKEIQILIWNILGGLSYSEMDSRSQKITDEMLPEYKKDLEKSYLQQLNDKWNSIAEKSQGTVPAFQNASEEYLSQLGTIGPAIVEAKQLHDRILKAHGDYEILRASIGTQKTQQKETTQLWSKISDRIYARFVTNGTYNEVGFLQVRVTSAKRQVSATQSDDVTLDISSIVADPNNKSVQSLALFPLYSFGGVAIESAVINPYAATALMAAILAAKAVDWNAFFDLAVRTAKFSDQTLQEIIKRGYQMMSEKFTENEKELRENKIISGKNKNSESKSKKPTRQYEKTGDEKTLQEDFDKLPGDKKDLGNGKEFKELPSGRKAIKRPRENGKAPTLEIQPPLGSDGTIKVRYSK
jgi:hypothetical protein